MQRFLTFVVLILLTIPVGLSLQGCANKNSNYCNGVGYGYSNSQPVSISLQPQTTGLSVAFSQTSQLQAPSALNCKGASASVGTYTYGTSDRTIADVSPTGAVCGGTWNLPHPRGGGLHHLHPHQQDRHRVYDRQRGRIYQQPGGGVFPSSHHQPAAGGPDQQHDGRAHMPFSGPNLATGRQGLLPTPDQQRSGQAGSAVQSELDHHPSATTSSVTSPTRRPAPEWSRSTRMASPRHKPRALP